jgi:type IV pilus biogenesis protein CpaD/CtpE
MRGVYLLAAAMLLAGCAASPPAASPPASNPPGARAPVDECRADVERLTALLAAEAAERQRLTRTAARREEALRRQLDAMKAIERGILERDDRMQTETR